MHKARKRFGQNFLVDERIIADIVRAIHPEAADNMVEIGPGLGALTRPLLKKLNHLHVVEIDRDIIARLENDYPKDKLVIHAGDALKFDLTLTARAAAHCGQPALQHLVPTAVPLLRLCRAHHRHALHAAERSGRAHGGRAFHARLWPPVRDAAIPFLHGKAARRAAGIIPPGAQGGFRHRAHDSAASEPR